MYRLPGTGFRAAGVEGESRTRRSTLLVRIDTRSRGSSACRFEWVRLRVCRLDGADDLFDLLQGPVSFGIRDDIRRHEVEHVPQRPQE